MAFATYPIFFRFHSLLPFIGFSFTPWLYVYFCCRTTILFILCQTSCLFFGSFLLLFWTFLSVWCCFRWSVLLIVLFLLSVSGSSKEMIISFNSLLKGCFFDVLLTYNRNNSISMYFINRICFVWNCWMSRNCGRKQQNVMTRTILRFFS